MNDSSGLITGHAARPISASIVATARGAFYGTVAMAPSRPNHLIKQQQQQNLPEHARWTDESKLKRPLMKSNSNKKKERKDGDAVGFYDAPFTPAERRPFVPPRLIAAHRNRIKNESNDRTAKERLNLTPSSPGKKNCENREHPPNGHGKENEHRRP